MRDKLVDCYDFRLKSLNRIKRQRRLNKMKKIKAFLRKLFGKKEKTNGQNE